MIITVDYKQFMMEAATNYIRKATKGHGVGEVFLIRKETDGPDRPLYETPDYVEIVAEMIEATPPDAPAPFPQLPGKVGHDPDTVSAVFDLETAVDKLIDVVAWLAGEVRNGQAG